MHEVFSTDSLTPRGVCYRESVYNVEPKSGRVLRPWALVASAERDTTNVRAAAKITLLKAAEREARNAAT